MTLAAAATAMAALAGGCAPRAPLDPLVRSGADGDSLAPSSGAVREPGSAAGTGGALGSAASGEQVGLATWYGAAFAGKRTASGERFDPGAMTAAHRTLPFGTWVEVRRTHGDGASVRVRITDRGPFGDDRKIIDLSRRAAQVIGVVRLGSAEVSIRVVPGP